MLPKLGQKVIIHQDRDRNGFSFYRGTVIKINEPENWFVVEAMGWTRYDNHWINLDTNKFTISKSEWEVVDDEQDYAFVRNQARDILRHYKGVWEECKTLGKKVGMKNIITKSIAESLELNPTNDKIKEALKEYREIMESVDKV